MLEQYTIRDNVQQFADIDNSSQGETVCIRSTKKKNGFTRKNRTFGKICPSDFCIHLFKKCICIQSMFSFDAIHYVCIVFKAIQYLHLHFSDIC